MLNRIDFLDFLNNYYLKGKSKFISFHFKSHIFLKTLLHLACEDGNLTLTVELLKKHDIDVNKSAKEVNTKSNGVKIKTRDLFGF